MVLDYLLDCVGGGVLRILGRAINRFKLITLSSMTAIWYGAKLPKPFCELSCQVCFCRCHTAQLVLLLVVVFLLMFEYKFDLIAQVVVSDFDIFSLITTF